MGDFDGHTAWLARTVAHCSHSYHIDDCPCPRNCPNQAYVSFITDSGPVLGVGD